MGGGVSRDRQPGGRRPCADRVCRAGAPPPCPSAHHGWICGREGIHQLTYMRRYARAALILSRAPSTHNSTRTRTHAHARASASHSHSLTHTHILARHSIQMHARAHKQTHNTNSRTLLARTCTLFSPEFLRAHFANIFLIDKGPLEASGLPCHLVQSD